MPAAPHFTKANASEYARKGNAIRWARYRQPDSTPAISLSEPVRVADNGFQARRLERVRAQLDLVDLAIENEAKCSKPDGQRLNWLAQAQDRLAEQERILAGRPLPGSRRPKDEPTHSSQPGAWIVEAEPAPSSNMLPAPPACGVQATITSVVPEAPAAPTPQEPPKP